MNEPRHPRPPQGAPVDPAIYRILAEQARDGIVLHRNHRIIYANPAVCRLVGRPLAEVLQTPSYELIHPDERERVLEMHDRRVGGLDAPHQYPLKLVHADGSAVLVEANVIEVSYEGEPALLVTIRDNAAQVEYERRLGELTAEYEMIVHSSHDALALLDVQDDGTARFRRVNAAVERLAEVDASEILGRTAQQVFGSRLHAAVMPHYESCLLSGNPESFEFALGPGDAAKAWYCTLVPIVRDGTVRYIVVSAHDITERRRMEEEIRQLSFTDNLTGLYNRRYFEQELRRLDGGRDYPVSIICGDVDGLKLINDTMGHREGDRLIKAFARILRRVFRKSDVVARVGGDEFAVAMARAPLSVAEERCQRLERLIAVYNRRHPRLPLSASFGIATAGSKEQSLAEAFNQADKNMYEDKVHRTAAAAHSIVRALITTLEERDGNQHGQISIVPELSRLLGESVGLGKREMNSLTLLAEMHDLGKVGVSDKILDKRGRLTRGEREQIKQHSMIGYRIARSSPELSHIADLILHHHEWYDGGGYPMGLSGDEIPLACRIMAIVDAYDAMTHDRPYRPAMSHERAIQELRFYAGMQFDPELTERFIELIGDGNGYRRGLAARTTTPAAVEDSRPPS